MLNQVFIRFLTHHNLPLRYMPSSRWTNILRQLSHYQFRRIKQGKDAGAYYHESFLRGRPDLTTCIIRRRVSTKKSTVTISHDSTPTSKMSPNLLDFPPCQYPSANEIEELSKQVVFLMPLVHFRRYSGKKKPQYHLQATTWRNLLSSHHHPKRSTNRSILLAITW